VDGISSWRITLRILAGLEDEELNLFKLSQTLRLFPVVIFTTIKAQLCLSKFVTCLSTNRTEQAILAARALEVAQITGPCELVELGSGSSHKTRLLLDAYSQLSYPLCY